MADTGRSLLWVIGRVVWRRSTAAKHILCKVNHTHREKLLEQIRRAVCEVEPDAVIILYGSRSRGDALSESDCDVMEQESCAVPYDTSR